MSAVVLVCFSGLAKCVARIPLRACLPANQSVQVPPLRPICGAGRGQELAIRGRHLKAGDCAVLQAFPVRFRDACIYCAVRYLISIWPGDREFLSRHCPTIGLASIASEYIRACGLVIARRAAARMPWTPQTRLGLQNERRKRITVSWNGYFVMCRF